MPLRRCGRRRPPAQEEAYEQRGAAQNELPRMRHAAPQQDAPRRGYDGFDEANGAMPSAEEEARLQEIRRQRRRRAYEGTLGERRRASFMGLRGLSEAAENCLADLRAYKTFFVKNRGYSERFLSRPAWLTREKSGA